MKVIVLCRLTKFFPYSVGRSGKGDVETYCHAGGLNRMICSQVNENTIVISS